MSSRCVMALVAVLALVAGACSGSVTPTPTPPTAAPTAAPIRTPSPVPVVSPTAPPTTPAPTSGTTLASLIATGAKVESFATGLGFAEGPLWLPDGRLIVSEVFRSVVVVLDSAGTKGIFRSPSNNANGHAGDTDGAVLEAQHGDAKTSGAIARLSSSGQATVLADHYQGKRFNSPNDLIVKSDGTIWFTDPDYGRAFPPEIGFKGVYRLDPATGAVTLLTNAFSGPNGIAFSPDEMTLYVSDTSTVWAFPINADDTLGTRKPFGRGCDGIGVDEQGNVWATTCGAQIAVTDPRGIELGDIPIPGTTTNLAWGGTDGKTLFITTQEGAVYRLLLTVRETH